MQTNAKTITVTLIVLVVVASFAISYSALESLARAANIYPLLAWAYPLCVDGCAALAAVATTVLSKRPPARTRAYLWLIAGLYGVVSFWANAVHGAGRPLTAFEVSLVAGIPPVSMLIASHVGLLMLHGSQAKAVRVRPAVAVRTQPAIVPAAGRTKAGVQHALIVFRETGEWVSGPVLAERFGVSRKTGARWVSSARELAQAQS